VSRVYCIAIAFLSMTSCMAKQHEDGRIHLSNTEIVPPKTTKMKITIGSASFTATLYDNAAANAFKALLPLSIDMAELNGNEKYFYLPNKLPVDAAIGGNIQVGDLMLYGNNCLVLFYEKFNTSYAYTKLGKVDDVDGLAIALGGDNVMVKFELL
jgi:hypothetical protein